jgi:hypothetical protein
VVRLVFGFELISWGFFGKNLSVVDDVLFADLLVFLRGVLGKGGFRWWLNRGEIVVDCVVNVDAGMLIFRGRKMGHQFPIYFCWRLATPGAPLKWFAGMAGTSNSHGEIRGSFTAFRMTTFKAGSSIETRRSG